MLEPKSTLERHSINSLLKSASCYLCIFLSLSIPCAWSQSNPPLGLPRSDYPANDTPTKEKIALGKKLFFDKRLSANGKISCATCHQPELYFTDGKIVAEGIDHAKGTRNTPSILNATYNTSQFWDGRRDSLETQALDPLFNPREQGLDNETHLLKIVRSIPTYRHAFKRVFKTEPSNIQAAHIAQSLASFERTLVAGNSPFDYYFYAGRREYLSPSAERGLSLFRGRAQCATCHTIEKDYATFTDNEFHSLSVGSNSIDEKLPILTTELVGIKKKGLPIDQSILSDHDISELGRFAVTLKPTDIGKFRTPSLRNVALTAPYMHDGSVSTLEEAVELEIYYRSGESGKPLILTPEEKHDVVEFLKALSGIPEKMDTR